MGRIADYLADEAERRSLPVRIERLETRGGSIWRSVPTMARAIARLLAAHLAEPKLLLHVNVAERSSVLRKGALLLLARALGRPVLLHLHAAQIVAFEAALPPPLAALLGWVFRRATLSVVLGEAMREWMIGRLGVPPDRVVILRNGVPLIPVAPPLRGSRFKLLFLGNLSARKGVSELLDAVARLPFDGELVLAGGGEVEHFRTVAAACSLTSLRFTGWLDAAGAASELAGADALVLPSHDEGLPLVILEALGRRVPVIATPVGAIPEVLRDGETALLVPPGDAAALAAAIGRLAADPALRQRLAENGHALYQREFTAQVFADRMIALYLGRCGLGAFQPEALQREAFQPGAFQAGAHASISAPQHSADSPS